MRRSRLSGGASPSPGVSESLDLWKRAQMNFKDAYDNCHLVAAKLRETLIEQAATMNLPHLLTGEVDQQETEFMNKEHDLAQIAKLITVAQQRLDAEKSELAALENGKKALARLMDSLAAQQDEASLESATSKTTAASKTAGASSKAPTSSKAIRKRKRGDEVVGKTTPKRTRGVSEWSSSAAAKIHVGSQVAFRLRKIKGGEEEWIQCEVTKVLSDIRFEVQDPEPDENNNPGQSYKASIRDIILIPVDEDWASLPVFPSGTTVLARYPETTTFYRAEVIDCSRRDGKCRLKFEGEEEEGKETDVDRRLVLALPR